MGLPKEFSRVRFRDAKRAELNVGRLARTLPEPLQKLLPVILGQLPDPDTALNHLERFSPHLSGRVRAAFADRPVLMHYLLAFFSYSRTLTETLLSRPEPLLELAQDRQLDRMKTPEDLFESYARFEAVAGVRDPGLCLVRFKRREALRIALKDIIRLAGLTETTLELSVLADVLVQQALTIATKNLERRFGWPHESDVRGRPVRSRFAVVSLGKLGGNELNYDSDIDLLFLYGGEGATPGGESGQRLAASEFFLRLGQELMGLLTGHTAEGAVYRVDVRLRPGGGEGDLVVSLPAALQYYRTRAREWERQMLLKARHSAGDESLFREFAGGIEALQYEPEDPQSVVAAVNEARRQMDRKLAQARSDTVDVKLSPGGIRDLEFLVQCLQRLYGGADRWVRARGTLLGLQRLADKGYISPRDHHELASAYQFFRLVEHRLQLDQGKQTHSLPAGEKALTTLAFKCETHDFRPDPGDHHDAGRRFLRYLDGLRDTVQQIRGRVLGQAEENLARPFRLSEPVPVLSTSEGARQSVLREIRLRSESVHGAALEVVTESSARRLFQDFLGALLGDSEAFEVVERSPELLGRVAGVMRASKPVGEWLARDPGGTLILEALDRHEGDPTRPLFGDSGDAVESREDSEPPFAEQADGSFDDFMSQLRVLHRRFLLGWGLEAVAGAQEVRQSLARMSQQASRSVRRAWRGAGGGDELLAMPVFLGRLGLEEMDLGSDLDLIFVAADEEAQRAARPVAERCIQALSAYTREGALYQVDARLRPDGQSGELVQTEDGFLDYVRGRAQVWEAAAYLKAAPLSPPGSGHGEEWWNGLRAALLERFGDPGEVRDGLAEMRLRLETESAQGPDDFKNAPGGVYDIDFILSLLAFRTGSLRQGGQPLAAHVGGFANQGALDGADAEVLADALLWFRSVDHAIRLVTGKSASTVPTGRTGELVAELAGRRLDEPMSVATLATELAEHQQRVRAVYERIFGR